MSMSRMEYSSKREIICFEHKTFLHTFIILKQDGTFFKNKADPFEYAINKYTGNDYEYLNNYLRTGKVSGNKFTEQELISWAYCLFISLRLPINRVDNYTTVWKGISNCKVPKNWKKGYTFVFNEFVSTSVNKNVAKRFSNGGIILTITLTNTYENYCRFIGDISQYKDEEEILIISGCKFTITDIDGNNYYLECYGYDSSSCENDANFNYMLENKMITFGK